MSPIMLRRPSFLLALVCAVAAEADAQQSSARVTASLSSARIAAGESTVLQVDVETSGAGIENFELPDPAAGLEVIGSREFSQLQVSVPGGRSRLIRREIVLQAHLAGEYVLAPVSVSVDGQTYRTRPLSLVVEATRGPAAARRAARSEVRLRAWLEPETVYVGEQIVLSAEALFPRDLRQRQSRPASYEAPTPQGFWIQDLPEPVTAGLRSIDGDVHETQTFRRAYFPLVPGRLVMPPARLIYEIRRGFLYAPETRELISDSLRVTVLPIPEEGRPDSFTGAVGRFDVSARIEPDVVGAGDAATLIVEVRGTGNIKALPPPVLPELPNVELYPPSEESTVDGSEDRISGTKRFTWVVISQDAGRVELPEIRYGYFDPEHRRFDEARAPGPLALRVTPQGSRVASSGAPALRYLRARPAGGGLAWIRSPGFVALQVVPLFAIVLAIVFRRGGPAAGMLALRRMHAERHASFEGLRRAASSAESDRVFFGDFAAVLRGALADLLDRPDLRGGSRESITVALATAGLPREIIDHVSTTFERMDHARFARAPASAADRLAMVADARRLVDRIGRTLVEKKRPRRRGAAVAIALLLGLSLPVQARAQSAFAQGVAAFQQERYREAVEAFSAHVQHQPRDANGWYNLGNAHARLDQRGRAVQAWLRALDIQPRHTDARHNLAVLAGDATRAFAPPGFTLAVDEALLIIALLWWVGALGAAGMLVTGRRGSPILATAFAVAAAVAALALPAVAGSDTAVSLTDEVALLGGPALRAEELGRLPEGAAVHVLERRGDWWRIRTPEGREGWAEARFLGEV